MAETKGFYRSFEGKLMEVSALSSFKIFTALVAIDLVYSAAKDFSFGHLQGVMSVVGS